MIYDTTDNITSSIWSFISNFMKSMANFYDWLMTPLDTPSWVVTAIEWASKTSIVGQAWGTLIKTMLTSPPIYMFSFSVITALIVIYFIKIFI